MPVKLAAGCRVAISFFCFGVAATVAACSGSSSSGGDNGTDSGSDATTPDANVGPDTSADAGSPTEGLDSSMSVDADSSAAKSGDAKVDAEVDASSDAKVDAEIDGSGDATVDAEPDSSSPPPCFVPYGCTAYVCASPADGGTDAGEGGVGTVVNGAMPARGPLAVLAADAGAADAGATDAGSDAGPGADEAYAFASGNTITGTATALPQGNADRTVMLWENEGANTNAATFFNYGSFVTDERCGILSHGGVEYFVGENDDVTGNSLIDDGMWHHLAVTYTSSTSALTLYVDGMMDQTETLTPALNTTGQAWAIGTTVSQTLREPLIGSVSDIRVYNRVLTATEIAEAATFKGASANPEALRSATSSGLVFWLPLFGTPEVEQNRCAP